MAHRKDIEPGENKPEPKRAGIDPADRVVLIVAAVILGGCFIGGALLLRGVITGLTGMATGVGAGVGLLGALPVSIALAVVLMLLFGLVAGDTIGELPTMLAGFFLMTAFFTIVIAVIY